MHFGDPPYFYTHFFDTLEVTGDGACLFTAVQVSIDPTFFQKSAEQLKALAKQLRRDVITSALELLQSDSSKGQHFFKLSGLSSDRKKQQVAGNGSTYGMEGGQCQVVSRTWRA